MLLFQELWFVSATQSVCPFSHEGMSSSQYDLPLAIRNTSIIDITMILCPEVIAREIQFKLFRESNVAL